MTRFRADQWALILGGSSGFGLAAAREAASRGMSVCVVHRDRRGAMPRIEDEFGWIRAQGGRFIAVNEDALTTAGRERILAHLSGKKVRLLLHSIAWGNLRPIQALEEEDLARTIHAMGTSLLTWTLDLHRRDFFESAARVVGLSSEGSSVSWKGYAAVAAAKAALESVCRSIAVELGPCGIRASIVQPGVTDTPALRAIPGHEAMKASAAARNPLGRLTLPEDVARVICFLCSDDASWINGGTIHVDGGEHVAAP